MGSRDRRRSLRIVVNYRANVWAFRELGVDHLLGINTVGGISPDTACGSLVLPDQLIDYSWGREHSYTRYCGFPLRHVEFTKPFSTRLRDLLLQRSAPGRYRSPAPRAPMASRRGHGWRRLQRSIDWSAMAAIWSA